MPKACIKAYHEMEERYARLELDYFDDNQKNLISDSINAMTKKYEITPEVTIEPKGEGRGEYIIEFHDDYDKKSGDFFEELIKNLNIDHCEVE